ncbi:UNVERIFIED_CONTAM: hypothetical protein GTU68_037763 [Idotea baltica]|nr:hypothetical protein [Idotea baltica]
MRRRGSNLAGLRRRFWRCYIRSRPNLAANGCSAGGGALLILICWPQPRSRPPLSS